MSPHPAAHSTPQIVRYLGEVGAVGGLVLDSDGLWPFIVYSGGSAWNLANHTPSTYALKVRRIPDGTAIAINGAVTAASLGLGSFLYNPGTDDPIHAISGPYEGRLWVTHNGEVMPSDLFRFSIGEGPAAS